MFVVLIVLAELLTLAAAFVAGAVYGRREAQIALDFANSRLAALRARLGE